MNDMSLIGHMSGQGEVVADKLRQTGYTTLQKIIEEKPSVLAESTGLEPNIVNNIITSAKNLGGVRPAAETEAKVEKKAKTIAKAKIRTVKAAPSKKKVKGPAEKLKEPIPEKPIFDPLRRAAHSFAAEHKIPVATAIRFVDGVKKSSSIRGKMFKEVMARDKFRQRLAHHLARELT